MDYSTLEWIALGISIVALVYIIFDVVLKTRRRNSHSIIGAKHPTIGYQFTHDAFKQMYDNTFTYVGNNHYTLRSKEGLTIPAGKSRIIGTGVMFDIPKEYNLILKTRSGLAVAHNLFISNAPARYGVEDTGEIKVVLHNADRNDFRLKPGNEIADFCLELKPTIINLEKTVTEND